MYLSLDHDGLCLVWLRFFPVFSPRGQNWGMPVATRLWLAKRFGKRLPYDITILRRCQEAFKANFGAAARSGLCSPQARLIRNWRAVALATHPLRDKAQCRTDRLGGTEPELSLRGVDRAARPQIAAHQCDVVNVHTGDDPDISASDAFANGG